MDLQTFRRSRVRTVAIILLHYIVKVLTWCYRKYIIRYLFTFVLENIAFDRLQIEEREKSEKEGDLLLKTNLYPTMELKFISLVFFVIVHSSPYVINVLLGKHADKRVTFRGWPS